MSSTRRPLVLGATVRALGAWPSGWRHDGAHRDPADDPELLGRIAVSADRAGLDFLFFGDWLETSAAFELTDPHLLARIDPVSTIAYLSALTTQVGLIATLSSSYSEPYTAARTSASIDLLSRGRAGINVATGADERVARNYGWSAADPHQVRLETAAEFIDILRAHWDSWEPGAFIADASTGRLIDPDRVHAAEFVGRYRSSAGPLNVLRPPQGHPPVSIATSSPKARELAVRYADIAITSPVGIDSAVDEYDALRTDLTAVGRDPSGIRVISTILPIVAPTRAAAWQLYDELVRLVPLADVASLGQDDRIPANRTIRSLAGALGVPLNGVLLDEPVPPRIAARFSDLGNILAQVVLDRSGRRVGGERSLTFRHLLVAHAVPAPVVVGSGEDIADYIEAWYSRGAVDGFTVLSAFQPAQFDDFLRLVVPELRRRGLLGSHPAGSTLRERLGLSAVAHPRAGSPSLLS